MSMLRRANGVSPATHSQVATYYRTSQHAEIRGDQRCMQCSVVRKRSNPYAMQSETLVQCTLTVTAYHLSVTSFRPPATKTSKMAQPAAAREACAPAAPASDPSPSTSSATAPDAAKTTPSAPCRSRPPAPSRSREMAATRRPNPRPAQARSRSPPQRLNQPPPAPKR